MTRPTRTIQLEIEIEGSPEDAWTALTTGDGLSNWFPLDATVEPEEGGRVWLSWGPGCEGEAPIHIWEPGRRFGWTESYGDDEQGRPIRVAVDFHIEGKGGTTVVRLVQSGLSASADWDEMYDALVDGWTYFLFNLRHWFRHHRGRERQLAWKRAPTSLDREAAWRALLDAELISPADPDEAAEVRLDTARPAVVVSKRQGRHFAATLPELADSLYFVELEGRHIGFWLSTYALPSGEVAKLQASLDARIESALGEAPDTA